MVYRNGHRQPWWLFLFHTGRAQYYRSQKIILNNPKCFLPAQVVEAQIYLKE
jgi:hypothetical protein